MRWLSAGRQANCKAKIECVNHDSSFAPKLCRVPEPPFFFLCRCLELALSLQGFGESSRDKGDREDQDAEGKSSRKKDNRKNWGRNMGEWKERRRCVGFEEGLGRTKEAREAMQEAE